MATEAELQTNIIAVVVTYGDRWCYLKTLLARLENEKLVTSVVIVDNASRVDVATVCCQAGFKKATVIKQKINIGSAGGFSCGIEYASSLDAEYIMLFDDDTVPHSTTIDLLLGRLVAINAKSGSCLNAILPNRDSQQLCLEAKLLENKYWMLNDSVLGLNVFNFFQRHFLRPIQNKKDADASNIIDYGLAAYAGLLFHKNICKTIGYPDRAFILYYDDIEYTNRILSAGGKIWICTDLLMDDIVVNYSSSMMSRPFVGLIFADNDAKVYYQVRNQIYFEYNQLSDYKFVYFTNAVVYAILSLMISVLCLRFNRVKAIQTAIYHGLTGVLGLNNNYKLC